MLGSSLPPVVYRVVLVLFTLFVLCLRIVVSNIYCVVFLFDFLRFVYPVLPVSLHYPFLIDPSVFSNVYYTQGLLYLKLIISLIKYLYRLWRTQISFIINVNKYEGI